MSRRRKVLLVALGATIAVGVLVWRQQSRILGVAASSYLARIASTEEGSGALAARRRVLDPLHRRLLLTTAPDALVPELFDLLTALSAQMATGEVSVPWAAYIYTAYERDLVRDRPAGAPRRSTAEVAAELARYREFYAIQKRPDEPGWRFGDLVADGDDVITRDEIDEAERTGRPIDLRTRGLHD